MKKLILNIAVVLAGSLFLLGQSEAGAAQEKLNAFAKVIPGQSKAIDVIKVLGKPVREFEFSALDGERPVHLSHNLSMLGLDASGKPGSAKKEVTSSLPLRVFEYKGASVWQPYYVVFKNEKVYYKIEPLGKAERDLASVEARIGKPVKVRIERGTYGHMIRTLEVLDYHTHGVSYLRRPGKDRFGAKLTWSVGK